MVEKHFKIKSQIFSELIFDEKSNKINSGDKKTQVSLYEMDLFDQRIVISLGKINNDDYIGRGIITFPVYIITKDLTKIEKIGLYEIKAKHYPELLDNEDDIKISYIHGPLLFDYFDKTYLEEFIKNNPLIEKQTERDDEDESVLNEKGDFDPKEKSVLQDLSIEEDDDEAIDDMEGAKEIKKTRKNFVRMENDSWIKTWKQNNNFGVIDEGGAGDCLFLTISAAYKSIGIDMSVKKQRELISKNINEDQYKTYFELYNSYYNEIIQNNKKIKILEHKKETIKKEHKVVVQRTKEEKDAKRRKELITEVRSIKNTFEKTKKDIKQLENELEYAKVNIEDVKWMKGIKSLKKLKEFVKTCEFWADSYAIHLLEELLYTKIIILSKPNYDKGDINNVLLCSDMTSTKIEKRGVFKPKYYIMVEHSGDHYRIITYKDKKIFRFHEIPFDIKDIIVKKCMSSEGKNIYNYIPKFSNLIGISLVDNKTTMVEEKQSDEKQSDDSSENIKKSTELFSDDVTFVFYSDSANVSPGKGKHEKIPKEMESEFKELKKMKHWRRVLSNFWITENPFELDGNTWNSVEHYYQAQKFRNFNDTDKTDDDNKEREDFYKKFTAESKSKISNDASLAKLYGGKDLAGKYRPKHIKMDKTFDQNKSEIMKKAQREKYKTDELSKKVLLLTKNAKLVHLQKNRGKKSDLIDFRNTMEIRKELSK
jgi:predicted NAD-dependent protein-ADP-ribosyltransferase YbiA (DUF1768 family)